MRESRGREGRAIRGKRKVMEGNGKGLLLRGQKGGKGGERGWKRRRGILAEVKVNRINTASWILSVGRSLLCPT